MKDPKTAAITGGAAGIGYAVAEELARANCRVVIGDRNADGMEEAKKRIEQAVEGATVETVEVEVADEAQLEHFIKVAAGDDGKQLGTLVTCAAIWEVCDFIDLNGEVFDKTADVNLRGTVLCAAAAARAMRDGGGGRIVLLSSVDAVLSEPGNTVYSAAKSGLNSVVKSIAVDLSRHNIQANAIAPGWVETSMTGSLAESSFDGVNTLNRAADAGEIANLIRYLALDAPDYLTGSLLTADGGQTAIAAMPH